MKIFVTGATGFIGRNLILSLKQRHYQIMAFVLSGDNEAVKIAQDNPEISYGDIRDKGSIEKAIAGADAVIHLAAIQESNDPALNEEINYIGVKNLVETCRKYSIKRLIHLSSISTCYKVKSHYGTSKAKADQYLMSSFGIDYTILRPTLVYGNTASGPFHTFLQILDKLPLVIPVIGNGRALKQPVFVEDVVSAIILALETDAAIGKYYDISGQNAVTIEEIIRQIMAKRGRKKMLVKIPVWMLYPLALVLEKVSTCPVFTRESLGSATQDATLDHGLIKKELGYCPVSFSEGLAKINL